MELTLGSLFDGIAGFPLSASQYGIVTKWASEIEPFPIKVSQKHFPDMKHLGDVTKINGAEVEPVDIISFGSPCQSVSVAGKRKGLTVTCKSCGHVSTGEVLFNCPLCDEETDVATSALFFEAIRIIEEMQVATNGKYPKALVFENVPGLLSSGKGKDFLAVLDNLQDMGFILDPNVLDAQYMGVPQRRRRVFIACLSVDIIRQMRTPISLSIISQLLIEILLCILNGQLNLSEGGAKNSIWKEKRFAEDGLLKRMKLFSIVEKRDFEKLLTNWTEICLTHLKEQSYLENHLKELSTTIKTDIVKSEFPTVTELEKLFGNTSRLWKKLLDDLYYSENSSIISIAKKGTMSQIIYGCANLLENTALLTDLLKSYCPISYETELFILTARKECTSYARQANSEIFTDVGWIQRWNNYIEWVSNCAEQLERYSSGECAREIFSECESVSGNPAESGKAREEVAAGVGDGVDASVAPMLRAEVHNHPPCVVAEEELTVDFGRTADRIRINANKSVTITSGGGGDGAKTGLYLLPIAYGPGGSNEVSHTIRAQASRADNPDSTTYIVEPLAFNGRQDPISGNITGVLDACHPQAQCVAYPDPANTLLAKANLSYRGDVDTVVTSPYVAGLDCRNGKENGDLCGTLQAKPNGGFGYNCTHPVRIGYRVRRLTPTECLRLQGLPDNWLDIEGASDSAKYKAIGNGMAKPCTDFIFSQIVRVLDNSR
ncbi:MAG: DNA (cytosine-5-)-methyltransferase [Desulfosporosinus sp.]